MRFDGARVTFYLVKEQRFDERLTHDECGPACAEDDMVKVTHSQAHTRARVHVRRVGLHTPCSFRYVD